MVLAPTSFLRPNPHLRYSPWLIAIALSSMIDCDDRGDASLQALEVEAGGINRVVGFHGGTVDYSIWVGEATEVSVKAWATDSHAVVRWSHDLESGHLGYGGGELSIPLSPGADVVRIYSSVPGGDARAYSLHLNPACAPGDCDDADPCTADSCDGGSATCWFRELADGEGACGDLGGVDRTVCEQGCDFVSIQAAIDAAEDGDAIRVGPGTYYENIDFRQKHISLVSTDGAESTVIDGADADTVVRIELQANRTSLLEGFTITNGRGTHGGGGVYTTRAAALIRRNIIRNNVGCAGAGIGTYFSPVVIENNVIRNNYDGGCTGNHGGGIHIGGTTIPAVSIARNQVLENESYNGGGIGVTTAEGTTVWNNAVGLNIARSDGGGIYFGGNFNRVYALQNLVYGNSATRGGGIHWDRGNPQIINNTIADNDSDFGSGLYGDQHNYETLVVNNIILASPGQGAVFCSGFRGDGTFRYNDVFSPDGGEAYDFICNDQTGTLGNVSVAPLFVDADSHDYTLQRSSPMVDAGESAAPHLLARDFVGRIRIADGSSDGVPRVDIGALELQPE